MHARSPWIAIALAFLTACGESHSTDSDSGTSITFDATPPPDGADVDVGPTTDSDVGAACASGADCDSGICIGEAMGFPGGYCTTPCGGGACPAGSECVPVGRGMAICLSSCDPSATDRTCREGYGCADSFMLPGPVCLPGCSDASDCPMGTECDPTGGFVGAGRCYDPGAAVGDACASMMDCPSMSFCLEESESGWPGGSCIALGCDVASGTGCDGDAVCLESGGGGGVCVDGCASDSDCRPELACLTDDDTGRTYCGPGCSTDSECSGARVCNPSLGTCDVAFTPGDLGLPCSGGASACDGGTCLTEFQSGFPGSYCVYVGCDPSAADPTMAGCPGDGVCVPIMDGARGACLDGCSSSTDCPRAGYACAPSDRADPASPLACMPACTTDGDCANRGFACNVGTGLCRPSFDPTELGAACAGGGCDGGVCISEADDGWPGGACVFPGCRHAGSGPAAICPAGGTCVDDAAGDPQIGICLAACTPSSSGECRPGYACNDEGGGAGACRPACGIDAHCTGGRACDVATGRCE